MGEASVQQAGEGTAGAAVQHGWTSPQVLPRRPAGRRWARRLAVGFVRAALLLSAVVVAARAVGGDQRTPLVELAILVPWVLPVLVVAVGLAVALRRRTAQIASAALLGVVVTWLAPVWGIGIDRPDLSAGTARPVTVMAFNTYIGAADPDAIVRTVRERQVDVLSLEEVTHSLLKALIAAGLREELPYQGGRAGNAAEGTILFSRWPLVTRPNVPSVAFGIPQVTVQVPDGPAVTVTGVHTLSPTPGRVPGWRSDLANLRERIAVTPGPQVVLGDFNATRDHAAFRALLVGPRRLVDSAEAIGLPGGAWPGFTWPNGSVVPPFMRLDHVLVSPRAVAVRSVDVVAVPGSDHRALVARLDVAADRVPG